MTTSAFFGKDARLLLLFSLPGRLKPIRAISRVAWTREAPSSASYDTGLQFVEILPEDRDAISGYVERGAVKQIWLR